MSEQTSRDEAVRVGAEAVVYNAYPPYVDRRMVELVLDAAHAAGLISYQDEWERVGWLDRGDFGALLRPRPAFPLNAGDEREAFVRRVSFEAGEEVNEEPGR